MATAVARVLLAWSLPWGLLPFSRREQHPCWGVLSQAGPWEAALMSDRPHIVSPPLDLSHLLQKWGPEVWLTLGLREPWPSEEAREGQKLPLEPSSERAKGGQARAALAAGSEARAPGPGAASQQRETLVADHSRLLEKSRRAWPG